MGRPRECLCHCGAIRENSLKPQEILTWAEPDPGCLIRNHPINPAVDAKEPRFVIYLDYGEFRLRDFWGLRHFLYGIADCDYFPAFELEGSMDDDARVAVSFPLSPDISSVLTNGSPMFSDRLGPRRIFRFFE